MSRLTSPKIQALWFLLGALGLVYFLSKMDQASLGMLLRTVDFLPIILLFILPFLWHYFHTKGWFALFPRGEAPKFGQLFRYWIVGDSLTNLTPVFAVTGEFYRGWELKRRNHESVLPNILLDNVINALTLIPIFFGGIWFFFAHTSSKWIWAFVAALFFLAVLGPVIFPWIPQKIVAPLRDYWRQVGPKKLLESFSFHLVGRLFGIVEIFLIGRALGAPIGLWDSWFLFAAYVFTSIIFTFVPAQLGALEGCYYLLSPLLGVSPTLAVTMVLVRRLRVFVWAFLGVGFFGWTGLWNGLKRPTSA